jgi:glycerate-2-kinase
VSHRITNFDELNTGALREKALTIAESAYTAIDTDAAIRSKISFAGTTLVVDGRSYDLSWFRRIRVIGFGKVSCAAAVTIESLLRGHITSGVVIDVRPGVCDVIEIAQGTHPKPSAENLAVSKRVVDMAQDSDERDLVIVIVSGGGSSLLCWPAEECTLSMRLYDDLLKTGATIEEMNTVRKHISDVKGGGLAKMLHPATVVGLVFCDVPGDHFEEVASGATYMDKTTVDDARAVLEKYHLSDYAVHETPKDQKFFERVHNVPIVSNSTALDAMEKKASELGFSVVRVGSDLFDTPPQLIERLFTPLKGKTAVIGAGEPSLTITHKGGKGGRCQYIALQALERVHNNEILVAFASDGIDNTEAAGAIADTAVRKNAETGGLSIKERLADYDTYAFFETSRGLIFTGKTDANVSDLFLLLRA